MVSGRNAFLAQHMPVTYLCGSALTLLETTHSATYLELVCFFPFERHAFVFGDTLRNTHTRYTLL